MLTCEQSTSIIDYPLKGSHDERVGNVTFASSVNVTASEYKRISEWWMSSFRGQGRPHFQWQKAAD